MKKEQAPNDQITLDKTDIQLLKLLQQNGKWTVRELAAKVNLSATPVHDRIKRLETAGVISHYAAIVDRSKLEQFILFYVNINLKEHSTQLGAAFISRITAFPEIVECYTIGGEHDFMIKVIVRDMAQYRRFFVEQLGEVPNIAKLQSIIVLDTIKHDISVPL
ncbi:Lrp/AsnC family transcriptional regulator [Flaviaesturariibacter amylovorans]|uniref:Lrp/AsnC family transcriptional regulator n=1 Tax=Flaviaesturariibacter amylovorans TaxID=1084520 RepID=A0ABP8H091_9BACT